MSTKGLARNLALAAYELGWRDGMNDVMAQKRDPSHPIGESKRHTANEVVSALDPTNLLGLQERA